MPNFSLAYFAHSLRSDWNNGNAHFLRGLMRSMVALGHHVTIFEPESAWSIENLHTEPKGTHSLQEFARLYPELNIQTYAASDAAERWRKHLRDVDVVVLHEWNPPALAHSLLAARAELGYKLLFHDTHHRASSSPQQIALFGLDQFDGLLAFGEALRTLYRERLNMSRVWTLHEAADTTIFRPLTTAQKVCDAVWVGNWGEGERSSEIHDLFLTPAALLRASSARSFRIYGVRYPQEGLDALSRAHVAYCGYLPNLEAPAIYSTAALTVHIPRQQYRSALAGIPTIRVFEALACGIPLLSGLWQDTEQLFRPGDFQYVSNTEEMVLAMELLLNNPAAAADQASRGLETVRARHTCDHRALELSGIVSELL